VSLAELEKRVKALEDIEEIKQLHIKYILLLNEQKFDEMVDCFADDAKLNGLVKGKHLCGKAEIAEEFIRMQKTMGETKYWKGGQFLVHPIISVDGDTATGCWTWYRIGMPAIFTSALGREVMLEEPRESRYDMVYKRVNGKWKMSVMDFSHTWPQNLPPGEVHTIWPK
jgi:hypothetical protein